MGIRIIEPATGAPSRGGVRVIEPAANVKGDGTREKPFDLSGGQPRASIPRGVYYKDPQGNIRRNDNGDRGNPIVQRRASVGGDVAFSTAAGLFQSGDQIAGMLGDVKTQLGTLTGGGALAAARRSGNPLLSNFADAAIGAQEIASQAGQMLNPLTLASRAAPTSQRLATERQAAFGQDYVPQTEPGRYGRAIGRMAPNALIPGGPVARAANVLAPAIGGETARYAAERSGVGPQGQAAAEMAGQVVGGVVAGFRPAPDPRPVQRPEIDKFRSISKADPAVMRQQAAEYRAAGIDPTLVDVSGDAGRGVIRDVAGRMDGSRQAVTDFYDTRTAALPGRIGRQAREVISQDPRNPLQIQADLGASRSAAGDTAFSAVRDERFTLNPDAVQALRSPDGRAAIDAAAKMSLNSLDPAERAIGAELNRLSVEMLDSPNTPITVGMAQQISKSLLDAGDAAHRSGSGRAGSLLSGLGRALRDDARTKVPGYDAALKQWEYDSRLMSAAETGGDFLKRDTDEFAAALAGMGPEEQMLARATARRALEARAGESIGAAPGLARTVAMAPEQQARNALLLGPGDAATLQNNLYRESMAVRNAGDVAPRTGAKTAATLMDAQAAKGVQDAVGTGLDVYTGNHVGFLRRTVNWFATRGINDAEASKLARAAIDPAQLDDVISYIERRYGPQTARSFVEFRKQALIAPALAGVTGAARSADTADQGQAPR